MKIYKIIILVLVLICCVKPDKSFAADTQAVSAQMNYCINSLTRLINATSVDEIDHEINQILNNLTMEQIEGMDDINLFRISLYNAATDAQINQEERELRKRLQMMRRDQAKWAAISSALDNAIMLIPGKGGSLGPQAAFYGVVTLVRSGVDYMNISKENDLLEQAELWELKKRDIETWKTLRSEAQKIVYNLYNKYHLKEYDRLTEETSNLYMQIAKEPNPQRRIRQLIDNKKLLGNQIDYNYYLGVSYYELSNYEKAEECFKQYEERYDNVKLFRNDEKSGLIALYRLHYSPDRSNDNLIALVNSALNNLPNNGLAYLTCAMVFLDKNEPESAGQIIRIALDNPNISNIKELLLAGIKLLPKLPGNSSSYHQLLTCLSNYRNDYFILGAISDVFLTKQINWNYWTSSFIFNKFSSKSWYTFGLGQRHLENDFEISTQGSIMPESYTKIYTLRKDKNELELTELDWEYKYGVLQSEIIKKVEFLREHPELINTFFDIVIPDSIYYVKTSINFESLKECEENCPQIQQIKDRLPLFSLSCTEKDDDGKKKTVKKNKKQISKLSKFLKKHINKSPDRNVVQCKQPKLQTKDVHFLVKSLLGNDGKVIQEYKLTSNGSKCVKFKGESFLYSPLYETSEEGDFVLVTRNSIMPFTVILKFNETKNTMEVYAICIYNTTYFRTPQKFPILKQKNTYVVKPTRKDGAQQEIKDDSNWLDELINVASPKISAVKEISSKGYDNVVNGTKNVVNDTKNKVMSFFGKEKTDTVSTKSPKQATKE